MPFDEQVRSVQNDIDFAARLGMRFIRSLVSVAPEVLVAAAPYAEDKGSPFCWKCTPRCIFDHPWIIRHAEAYEKANTRALGFPAGYGNVLARFPQGVENALFVTVCPQAAADFIEKAYMRSGRSAIRYHGCLMQKWGPGRSWRYGGNVAPQRGVRAEADARFYAADPQHSCQIL